MSKQKNILVAPLNWGLGHAARSIPIIRELMQQGHHLIIASDGVALDFLRKEFPLLIFEELPPYDISYSSNSFWMKLKLLFQTPKMMHSVLAEKKVTKELIRKYNIDLIISDNRFGVRDDSVRSIFITHQLKVLSGWTTWLSTKAHQLLHRQFDEIWVPDFEGEQNLSGILGHFRKNRKLKYVGLLSRFEKREIKTKYDLLVVLSGPEPQRSILEEKLLRELETLESKIVLIRGIVEKKQTVKTINHLKIYNFALSDELEKLINASDIIISRSGYTSIMDYCKLEKKVFFIPTPKQYEQEYLATYLEDLGIAPFAKQKDFNIKQLGSLQNYKGFSVIKHDSEIKEIIKNI